MIAHSSGNHAGAVGYAAARLDVPAVVVIPANAPPVKLAAVRASGAEIVTVAPSLSARVAATEELIARHGYTLIPPFDHPGVIAGQGTVGLEIAAQCPAADLVVVPVSGGGLIAGIAAAVKAVRPETRIVGVEPELAADARESLRAGRRIAWDPQQTQRTIADALRVEQVGELHLRAHPPLRGRDRDGDRGGDQDRGAQARLRGSPGERARRRRRGGRLPAAGAGASRGQRAGRRPVRR